MKKLFLILIALGCSFTLWGEVRSWEDMQGNKFEGEFVREMFNKLIIRETSGKEHTLDVKDLSDLDKKYVRVMVPPNMELTFKRVEKKKPLGGAIYRIQTTSYLLSGKATIKKASQRPFTARLYAEIYLIGEVVESRTARYILLSMTKANFLLTEENGYQYSFKIPQLTTTAFVANGSVQEQRGERYKGYLFVIRDAQKNIVDVQSNLTEWMTTPEMIANLNDLYLRGSGSMRSRYFDKDGNKAPVPTPKVMVPHQP